MSSPVLEMMHKYFQYQFKFPLHITSIQSAVVDCLADHLSFTPPLDFNLSQIHNYLTKTQLNDFRIKAFQRINKLDFENLFLTNCYSQLSALLGPDLLIQKKLNLSIQIPDDESSILSAHSDCSSGDSPFELVLWFPLTDTFSSNSMFIMSSDRSLEFYNSLKSNNSLEISPRSDDFLELSFGSYILFCPALVHGNVLNKTDSSRVSVNIRFKSVFSPYTPSAVSDRLYGTYYKRWKTTELFDLGCAFYKMLK